MKIRLYSMILFLFLIFCAELSTLIKNYSPARGQFEYINYMQSNPNVLFVRWGGAGLFRNASIFSNLGKFQQRNVVALGTGTKLPSTERVISSFGILDLEIELVKDDNVQLLIPVYRQSRYLKLFKKKIFEKYKIKIEEKLVYKIMGNAFYNFIIID